MAHKEGKKPAIIVYVTPEQHAHVKDVARRTGRTISGVIRVLINQATVDERPDLQSGVIPKAEAGGRR